MPSKNHLELNAKPCVLVVTKILIPLMSAGVSCLTCSMARCSHSLWTWWVSSLSRVSTSLAILVSTGLRFYNRQPINNYSIDSRWIQRQTDHKTHTDIDIHSHHETYIQQDNKAHKDTSRQMDSKGDTETQIYINWQPQRHSSSGHKRQAQKSHTKHAKSCKNRRHTSVCIGSKQDTQPGRQAGTHTYRYGYRETGLESDRHTISHYSFKRNTDRWKAHLDKGNEVFQRIDNLRDRQVFQNILADSNDLSNLRFIEGKKQGRCSLQNSYNQTHTSYLIAITIISFIWYQ